MKIKFSLKILFGFFVIMLCLNKIYAYERSVVKYGIDSFPSSYKEELLKLKQKHPNWNFASVYTNLDWNYTVEKEMQEGVSIIKSSDYSYKWKKDSNEVEIGYVNASKYAVEYFLDPRNFLSEEKIFQFEYLNFNEKSHSKLVIEELLKGTGMYDKSYYINDKEVIYIDDKYSDLIYEAGKNNNINPVHLASRIVQETSGSIASLSETGSVLQDLSGNLIYKNGSYEQIANRCLNGSYISSTYGDFTGYYNFFNIGAYCTSSCNFCGNTFVHGLEKAKSKSWTTPKLAINAAGEFLQNNYVKYGQNTVYFEKFDVNFAENALSLFGSQYMANISAASQESSIMYNGYKEANKLNSSFTFYIPVYDNMPSQSITKMENENPFKDINSSDWYFNAASYCYNNNIINGVNSYTFAPKRNVTRGMLVTMLYAMAGAPSVSGTCRFTDVSNSKYYYNAVLWASQNKVVNGYTGTTKFGPEDLVTREQLAVMLSNYAKYKDKYTASNYELTSFSDSSNVSSWALPAVRWAVKNRIINGSNGKINPKGTATRAEAVTMLYSYCLKFK